MGDPQAPFPKVLEILDRYGLLGSDGRLAPDALLVTIGDHFDYDGDPDEIARSGLHLVLWLASHPPGRVVMLAGNHDLCRVMELAGVTDERFAEAVRLAREIHEMERAAGPSETRAEAISSGAGAMGSPSRLDRALREFAERYPTIPAPELARRDWLGFRVVQRDLLHRLLLAGRLLLAQAATTEDGRPLLLTHASITLRELKTLEMPVERDPVPIARRLNDWLSSAVSRVAESWRRGGSEPLDLEPLHSTGRSGQVSRGVLCLRPANPSVKRDASGLDGKAFGGATRQYDPRALLPRGLLQACGHTGHRKCLKILGDWATDGARARAAGGLRTLRTDGTRVVYETGIRPVPETDAGLYMIDGEMHRVEASGYPLLEIAGLR